MPERLPIILVVEDDTDTRRFMQTWLELEGYRVRAARNGREALDLLAREMPCVMVVDLMMPVMDGVEFRRRQQEIPELARVPFVLVSGTGEAPRIARDLGIRDVVAKPCDAERLLDIVASHCRSALPQAVGSRRSTRPSTEAKLEEDCQCAT
jgi:CheY-like chemotaxis protein